MSNFQIKKLKSKDIFFDPFWIETCDRTRVNAYSDTDSILRGSDVITEKGKIKIEDLYDSIKFKETIMLDSKGYKTLSKEPKDLKILSLNIDSFESEFKNIKKIWKYKTTKKIYKIKIKTENEIKQVLCTEDHSIIIERNKEIKKIKLKDIQKGDKIIYLKNNLVSIIDDFEIEYIGEVDIELYDMEVEDNHNYFANDILLANSSYQILELPFNKFEDVHKTVDYTQEIASSINELYLDVLNTDVAKFANLDPEFNLMNFKSEVVAFRGFFRSKKYYGLAKIWDEGNFMPHPKLKKTGGQIVKADTTNISFNLLNDVYKYLVLEFKITDKTLLYKKIFIDLKNKYINQLKEDIKNFNISSFGIPKKWGLKEFKVLPKQVLGAMFYNTIIENTLRPGDSIMTVQVKVKNFKKILNYYKNLKNKNNINEYQLTENLINNKLNVISIPTGLDKNKEKINKLKESFNSFDIELDFDTIIDFNIDMKLIQFDVLFENEIKRKVLK